MPWNFHTHTVYCDGQATVSEMVDAALERGMTQLGFSSHAPLPFPVKWSLTSEKEIQNYTEDIHKISELTDGRIEIFSGLEADFISGKTKDFSILKKTFSLDFIIGSVHLVSIPGTDQVWFIDGKQQFFDEGIHRYFGGDGQKAALTYFRQLKEMIATQKFDIIGHFDKIKMNNDGRFFSELDDWYLQEIGEILDMVKDREIIMEVNTRGYYQGKKCGMYPSGIVLEMAAEKGVKVMINSDAHKTTELMLGFAEAKSSLQKAGCKKIMNRSNNTWTEIDITERTFLP